MYLAQRHSPSVSGVQTKNLSIQESDSVPVSSTTLKSFKNAKNDYWYFLHQVHFKSILTDERGR